MNFEIIKDDYYPTIPDRIIAYIPDFHTVFDKDEVYLMLGELSEFALDNKSNNYIIDKFIRFIDESVLLGGPATIDAIVEQVYDNIYLDDMLTSILIDCLSEKALHLFNNRNSKN